MADTAVEQRRATVSQLDQWMVQDQVFRIYDLFANVPRAAQTLMLELQRDNHLEYLTQGLKQLGASFVVLDANRPWLCYWILHSIALLGESIDYELENNAIDFLNRCQDSNGGYGGGPGQVAINDLLDQTIGFYVFQLPHLATTYAAVNSLVTLGGEEALLSINRTKLHTFLKRMKQPNGAFRMHDAGEIDVRACYTAISVASILNILDDELAKDVGNYILSCQTYEGGIAGEPGSEAHGGYTFCGVATMMLINEANRMDLAGLINWVVSRQGVECGFQGRTNKLVDGCYSFWQGGVFELIERLHVGVPLTFSDVAGDHDTDSSSEGEDTAENLYGDDDACGHGGGGSSSSHTKIVGHPEIEPLFHSMALQQYILLCSQVQEGGFRDKPGKARDYYHTCYCLSGLSICQYSWSRDENSAPLPRAVLGPHSNLLEPVHPIYNVVLKQYDEAHEFFSTS